ncbi:MAG: hypothetical protein KJ058_01960 [Thermoanaerobaculia bacterium]|nr:hypothetical protein [Thermoanaerobaculia bacterium]
MARLEEEVHLKTEVALSRVLSLRAHLERLALGAFTSSGSRHLLTLLLRLTYLHEYQVQAIEIRARRYLALDDQPPAEAENLVGMELTILDALLGQLVTLSKATRFIESSREDESTTEIPAILSSLVQTARPDTAIIVRPQSDWAYQFEEVVAQVVPPDDAFGVTPEPGKPPRFTRQSLLAELPAKLGVLSYPKIEADNVLLHSFGVSHELGHFADEILGLSEVSLFSIDDAEAERESRFLSVDETRLVELSAQVQKGDPLRSKDDHFEEIRKEVLGYSRRWLAEIAADLIATLVAGPAVAAAFFWLVKGEPTAALSEARLWDAEDTRNYPPPRFRLQLMLRQLRKLGYTQAVLASAPNLLAWLDRAEADPLPTAFFPGRPFNCWPKGRVDRAKCRLMAILQIVFDTISSSAVSGLLSEGENGASGNLSSVIQERLEAIRLANETPWVYRPEDFARECPGLVKDLRARLLPCQYFADGVPRPARFASVLCAGWEDFLELRRLELPPEEARAKTASLNQTLLVALEASQLHRRFLVEQQRLPSE